MNKLVLKDIKIEQIGSPHVANNTSSAYNADTVHDGEYIIVVGGSII